MDLVFPDRQRDHMIYTVSENQTVGVRDTDSSLYCIEEIEPATTPEKRSVIKRHHGMR